MATHFVGETAIAGYDLLNEPTAPTLPTDSPDKSRTLVDLYQRITSAIRSDVRDASHMLIYEGDDLAHNFEGFPLFDPNMALSFHQYTTDFKRYEANVAEYKAVADGLQVPIWNGEYGQDQDYSSRQLDWFARKGIAGQSMWTWKAANVDYLFYGRRDPTPAEPYKFDVTKVTSANYTWSDFIQYLCFLGRPKPTLAQATAAIDEFIRSIQFSNNVLGGNSMPPTGMLAVLLKGCRVNSSANCA